MYLRVYGIVTETSGQQQTAGNVWKVLLPIPQPLQGVYHTFAVTTRPPPLAASFFGEHSPVAGFVPGTVQELAGETSRFCQHRASNTEP